MKSKYLLLAWLFSGLLSMGALCSKEDTQEEEEEWLDDGYTEPTLSVADTWMYMENETLDGYYMLSLSPYRKRPAERKWIATKVALSFSMASTTAGNTDKNNLLLASENTDQFTRFLPQFSNNNGRERITIFLSKFDRTPVPGTYTITENYANGSADYNVYNAAGAKQDSTRTQYGNSSTFTITGAEFDRALSPNIDLYRITGTATLRLRRPDYISDAHTFQCTFNKIGVSVYK